MHTVWTPRKIHDLLGATPPVCMEDYHPGARNTASVAGLYRSLTLRDRAAFDQCVSADATLSHDWGILRSVFGPIAHPAGGWPPLDPTLAIESFRIDVTPVVNIVCYMTGHLFVTTNDEPALMTSEEFAVLSGHRLDQHIKPALEARATALHRASCVVSRPVPLMQRVAYTDGNAVGSMRLPLWLPDQATRYLEQRNLTPLCNRP